MGSDILCYEKALQSFLQKYPAYETTHALDDLRKTDFARLDAQGQIYLDYTGGGLYGESQLQKHMGLLQKHVLGNPHSLNPSSMLSTQLVVQARQAILNFFNASADELSLDEFRVCMDGKSSGAVRISVGIASNFADVFHFMQFARELVGESRKTLR